MAHNIKHPFITPWENYYFKPVQLIKDTHYTETITGSSSIALGGLTLWVNSEHILNTSIRDFRITFQTNGIKSITGPRKWFHTSGDDDGLVSVAHDIVFKNVTDGSEAHFPSTWETPKAAGSTSAVKLHGYNSQGQGYINSKGLACSPISLGPGVHCATNVVSNLATDNDEIRITISDTQAELIRKELMKNKVIGPSSCWIMYPDETDYVSTFNLPIITKFVNGTFVLNPSRVLIRGKVVISKSLAGIKVHLKASNVGARHNLNNIWTQDDPLNGDVLGGAAVMMSDIDIMTTNTDDTAGAWNHMGVHHVSAYNSEYRQDHRFYRVTITGVGNQNAPVPLGQFFQFMYIPVHT